MLRPARATALSFVAFLACGCAPDETRWKRPSYVPELYSSGAVEGRVVDAGSNRPIEGAVVVILWRKVEVFVERWDGLFLYGEVTTDRDGRFRFARWGPRPAPADAFIDKRSPEIWVIRRGYLIGFFDNAGANVPSASEPPRFVTLPPNKMRGVSRRAYASPPLSRSIWNGKDLRIRRAPSHGDLASSLMAANPLDPYYPQRLFPLDDYWLEWEASREQLPADTRGAVVFPPRFATDYLRR